jgi:hypothetical protein
VGKNSDVSILKKLIHAVTTVLTRDMNNGNNSPV